MGKTFNFLPSRQEERKRGIEMKTVERIFLVVACLFFAAVIINCGGGGGGGGSSSGGNSGGSNPPGDNPGGGDPDPKPDPVLILSDLPAGSNAIVVAYSSGKLYFSGENEGGQFLAAVDIAGKKLLWQKNVTMDGNYFVVAFSNIFVFRYIHAPWDTVGDVHVDKYDGNSGDLTGSHFFGSNLNPGALNVNGDVLLVEVATLGTASSYKCSHSFDCTKLFPDMNFPVAGVVVNNDNDRFVLVGFGQGAETELRAMDGSIIWPGSYSSAVGAFSFNRLAAFHEDTVYVAGGATLDGVAMKPFLLRYNSISGEFLGKTDLSEDNGWAGLYRMTVGSDGVYIPLTMGASGIVKCDFLGEKIYTSDIKVESIDYVPESPGYIVATDGTEHILVFDAETLGQLQ